MDNTRSASVIVDRDGAVGTITLNRPDKANAMNAEVLGGIEAGLREFEDDRDIKVVVLQGNGKGFSGGYDIGPQNAERVLSANPVDDWSRLRRNAERWLYLARYRKPTVARVHGYCLAGAFEMVSACDFVVAAEDARIGHPAVRQVGTPAFLLLPSLLPALTLKRMLLTGDVLSGREAEAVGFVLAAVPEEELDAYVDRLCARLTLMPLDQLIMVKAAMVRAYEIKDNISTMALSSVEYDAIAHQGPMVREFWNNVREQGLKGTVQERDTPFEQGPTV